MTDPTTGREVRIKYLIECAILDEIERSLIETPGYLPGRNRWDELLAAFVRTFPSIALRPLALRAGELIDRHMTGCPTPVDEQAALKAAHEVWQFLIETGDMIPRPIPTVEMN